MHLQFLGAATTVTGSQFLLTTERAKVLIDCGMFQGSPNESIRNRIPLAYEPGELDAILLTHAHLDHCGLIPHVVKEGFHGPIWATRGTVELAGLVLLDSGKLQQEFAKRGRAGRSATRSGPLRKTSAISPTTRLLSTRGGRATASRAPARCQEAADDGRGHDRRGRGDAIARPARARGHGGRRVQAASTRRADPAAIAVRDLPRDPETALRAQPPKLDIDLDEPLYTSADARASLDHFRPVDYDQEIEVAPGIHATFVDAGHILGSAIIRLRVADHEGGHERRIVFSGDLGRPGTPILRDPTIVDRCRLRPDRVDLRRARARARRRGRPDPRRDGPAGCRRKGVLLVPSFAIGRTQEVVWELDRLISAGEIPLLPLYLDSPMASRHRPSIAPSRLLRRGDAPTARPDDTPLDYPNQIITNDVHAFAGDRSCAAAVHDRRLERHAHRRPGRRPPAQPHRRPDGHVLFVGYQGEGTLGRPPPGRRERRSRSTARSARFAARSARSAASRPTPTSPSCWTGWATSPVARSRATRASRDGVPGPRRSGCPGGARAEGSGARVRGEIPQWHQVVELD